jgi:serine phosphatase RsbU (regulator of sigma subunit)
MSPDDEFERTMITVGRPAAEAVPAPDTIGHYLVIVEGAEPGRRLEFDATTPLTIGRDPQQTLVVTDPELSRRHARVFLVNEEPFVQDLGSTNGTFVDGERLSAPSKLDEGRLLRIGGHYLRYERRSRRDVEREEQLARDLRRASAYVSSLLPAPLTSGPVLTDWRFVPSTQLGGDAFGYYWLDPETFVFYLIDVSGHGVGSAMHSVTVLNVLRQRGLLQVDPTDPASVLANLNARFQMDVHNGLFFTMWYGVYRPRDRSLVCGAAGHHAAYLVPPDRSTTLPLGTSNLMIGAMPDVAYEVQRTTIPAGSVGYLFSDGAFEIETKDDQRWSMADFLPLLLKPSSAGTSEADRVYQLVRHAARPGPLDDDFSLMVISFP